MTTITEIEKRRGETEQHMLLVEPELVAFYQGMAAAFKEAIEIIEEVKE